MEKIKNVLKKIGLTENEVVVYLTLLKIGPSIVSKIAEKSEIYRPYVYDTLKRLSEKGLVSSVVKDNKKFFSALNPSHVLEIEKNKLAEINEILPSLNEILEKKKEETKVHFYSGKNILRIIQKEVIKILLEIRGESLVIGVDEKKFMETDKIAMLQFFEQMKQHKLKERVLVREGDNYLPGHEKTTKYKFLPKEFFSPNSTFIFGDKVAVILFNEPICGILIESKELAETYRKQFELLWKMAKNR